MEITKEYDKQVMAPKSISFNLDRFKVAEQKEHEYEHWIKLTAKLIKRPYFQTFKMVEKWSMEKIIRHYNIATKHNGNISSDFKWWAERKKQL